jgi:hypothetical protein
MMMSSPHSLCPSHCGARPSTLTQRSALPSRFLTWIRDGDVNIGVIRLGSTDKAPRMWPQMARRDCPAYLLTPILEATCAKLEPLETPNML